jgi:hypothetical protein
MRCEIGLLGIPSNLVLPYHPAVSTPKLCRTDELHEGSGSLAFDKFLRRIS